MKKFCLALDLKDDPQLIAEYERCHEEVWPAVLESIRDSGIQAMEIFRVGNRLVMIVSADDNFSFEKKARLDEVNEVVQRWESLMWKFQQPLPFAHRGEKWVLMKKIFDFQAQ